MLNTRQQLLLHRVIQEHIRTARPVGSKILSRRYRWTYSPATLRNDLAQLVERGFLETVRFSLGRIPTDKGWETHILNHSDDPSLPPRYHTIFEHKEIQDILKKLAQLTSSITFFLDETVFHQYGLSTLIENPEFLSRDFIEIAAEEFENLRSRILRSSPMLEQGTTILIGKKNPLTSEKIFSAIVCTHTAYTARYTLGLIGVKRMDYTRNVKLIELADDSITSK